MYTRFPQTVIIIDVQNLKCCVIMVAIIALEECDRYEQTSILSLKNGFGRAILHAKQVHPRGPALVLTLRALCLISFLQATTTAFIPVTVPEKWTFYVIRTNE